MRIGWALTQAATDLIFTRDGNHPADGAAVGTTSGTAPPGVSGRTRQRARSVHVRLDRVRRRERHSIRWRDVAHVRAPADRLRIRRDGRDNLDLQSTVSPRASVAYPISAIVPGALILTGPDVEAWAKVGDGTAIPVAKLTNVPAGTAVADWAEASNGDPIPANKLGNVPAGTAVADWAEDGNTDPIPANKLGNVPAGTAVADWAEDGNTDPIPADKLTNVPAGGGGGAPTFTELLSATSPEDFDNDTNVDMATAAAADTFATAWNSGTYWAMLLEITRGAGSAAVSQQSHIIPIRAQIPASGSLQIPVITTAFTADSLYPATLAMRQGSTRRIRLTTGLVSDLPYGSTFKLYGMS